MRFYSPGMAMRQNYGDGTCPHCKEDFQKTNKNQVTCSKMSCQAKQNSEANRKRRDRKKALRLEAAKPAESAGQA